jgi:cytohesin
MKFRVLVIFSVIAVLAVLVCKLYHQRKLDLTLAQLLEERASLDEIASLLQAGASPDVRIDEPTIGAPVHSVPALIFAYNTGQKNVIKLLLDRGANPNAPTSWGITPLANAASQGDLPRAKMLLSKGADANAADGFFGSPLIAAASSSPSVVNLLLQQDAKSTLNTARHPDESATALMIAAAQGRVEIVRALLRAGADPLIKDRNGKTALDYAKQGRNGEVIRLLSR